MPRPNGFILETPDLIRHHLPQKVFTYLGIDPGASGGLVALSTKGVISAVKMPATEMDAWRWFEEYACGDCFAIIEKVGGYIGENQPGSSAFKFGRNTGLMIGFLTAAHVPFEEVTPQRWQKGLKIPKRRKDESKTEWKNRLKSHASKLFPKVNVTLSTADAILISEFCRRSREGRI